MESIMVVFANGDTLKLNSGDSIIPVIVVRDADKIPFYSMSHSSTLAPHTCDGLIPSFIDAICDSDYFYVSSDDKTLYKKSTIVKIQIL